MVQVMKNVVVVMVPVKKIVIIVMVQVLMKKVKNVICVKVPEE
jgi:hypothetical protein